LVAEQFLEFLHETRENSMASLVEHR